MSALPFLVILAAIVAFFQDEFAQFFRQLFSHAWIRFLLPLLIVEVIIESYYQTVSMVLIFAQTRMHAIMLSFFKCFPYAGWAAVFSQFIFLFGITTLPILCFWAWSKRFSTSEIEENLTVSYAVFWLFFILLWAA